MAEDITNPVIAEFHEAVHGLARETAEAFKDNKPIRKALRKGQYVDVADCVNVVSQLQPEFDNDYIAAAGEKGLEGLAELAVDAAYAEMILELAHRWHYMKETMAMMPSLTWPPGTKVKS